MEHIIQLAINVDDERIRQVIEERAATDIIKSLKQDVADKLFEYRGYGLRAANPKTDSLSGFSEEIIYHIFEENRAEIIDKAGKYLAERLAKTKAAKEKLGEVLEE